MRPLEPLLASLRRCLDGFPDKRRGLNTTYRMADIGIMSKEDAISYGLSGPLLRAAGVSYDVRKATPYLLQTEL